MGYRNFEVAIYCPVGNLNAIGDLSAFEKSFAFLERHIHIGKVYLETHRSNEYISRERILELKAFFEKRGIKTSGGITTSREYRERDLGFPSLCYTQPLHRERIKAVVEMTAAIFDEIILDDFFFTNCKCESCIAAKGEKSWAEFRTELMREVSENLIVGPAKRVNPNVKMIIKYPNWYECYQETGYNPKDQPAIFDGIYTGTETRDPLYTLQHLPKYLSYFLMRYLENVMPGRNGGGWFDIYDCGGNVNYYAQQAYGTLLGKAKEVTLYCLGSLLGKKGRIFVPSAGYAFEAMDDFAGDLGNPVGTACYLPHHANGEDYLHNYLGMLGIPLEPYPEYPVDSRRILLTESAAADAGIIVKIQNSLLNGADVMVTSGFVKVLQDKGFDRLAHIRWTDRKVQVSRYAFSPKAYNMENTVCADQAVLLPVMGYATNDTWQLAGGLGEDSAVPVLQAHDIGKGRLYILTIPDDFGDLYHYPKELLAAIRDSLRDHSPVQMDAPAKIGLFTYDNDTFVVESFLPYNTTVGITIDRPDAVLAGLPAGRSQQGVPLHGQTMFTVAIQASEYLAFKISK